MEVLVTGATGFLGRHLVRALVRRGHAVRALVRGEAPGVTSDGAKLVSGDVLQPDTLSAACDGVQAVFHLAGKVGHVGEPTALYDLHVRGTRNVLAAAKARGAGRVVHVSTSGTVAVSTAERIHRDDAPWATETVRRWPYYLSKLYAEKVALEADLPVIVVSPSLLLGPGDEGLSSSTALVRFLRREVAAVPPGGLNFVDVRDAAEATAAAATEGQPGTRYLLGGPNLTIDAFFGLLAKVSGVPAPAIKISHGLTDGAARVLEALEGIGASEEASDESVAYAMAGHFWYLDASRAQADLGFTPRAAETTLRDAVNWLRDRGPLPRPGGILGPVVGGVRRAFGRR